ncbi:MAG: hypothetical protein AAFS04_09095 [Cyanobacteria bacterium J06631_9]
MSPNRTLTLTFSSLILLGMASCSGRVSQCNSLISTLNEAQPFRVEYEQNMSDALTQISGAQDLAQTQEAAKQYITTVETVTDQTSDLVQDLASLDIVDEQLLEYRSRYTTLITQQTAALETAQDSMIILATVESEAAFAQDFDQFQQRTNGAYSVLQSLATEETTLIEGINAYCDPSANADAQ